ncbi:hypothetical protein MKMG_02010 [Methanogenium sp. MK-MG]|nr:hypothetical protein MKMG_02010 [Methanogenium sp. MK-MG]
MVEKDRYTDAVTGDVLKFRVLHQRVEAGPAEEVTVDVVHDPVIGQLGEGDSVVVQKTDAL